MSKFLAPTFTPSKGNYSFIPTPDGKLLGWDGETAQVVATGYKFLWRDGESFKDHHEGSYVWPVGLSFREIGTDDLIIIDEFGTLVRLSGDAGGSFLNFYMKGRNLHV